MKNHFYKIILCSLLFATCNNEPDAEEAPPLPNTPESVVRTWQQYVDRDQFADARKLSTPEAISNLNAIETILKSFTDEEPPDTMQMVFLEMNCREAGNRAVCHYAIEEEGEKIRDSFILKKISGQWLVHIEENPYSPDGDLQDLFNSIEDLESAFPDSLDE